MKAIVLKEPGHIENLVLTEISEPVLRENEVLVNVKAISLNPVDVKTRIGKGVFNYGNVNSIKPLIIGWDIAGIVTKTESTRFNVGDEVFGMVNFPGAGSAYAEYVAAPADHLAIKPANISFDEAAAATLAPLTAWQVMVDNAGIKKGDRVLIHAASGGVGHYAVQLAKHLGAYVIGTSSLANRDFVLSLGADEHIDYKAQSLRSATRDVDFVLDCLGEANIEESLEVVRPGGKLISIVTRFTDALLQKCASKNVAGSFVLVKSSGTDMNTLASLLKEGKIKSHVSKRYSFNEMGAAHEHIETGRTVGKIVVNV